MNTYIKLSLVKLIAMIPLAIGLVMTIQGLLDVEGIKDTWYEAPIILGSALATLAIGAVYLGLIETLAKRYLNISD